MNRTWSILLWLLGEVILIAGFLHFGIHENTAHLVLNMSVSTVILTVFMMSLFRNEERLVKRGVGKGMKWFFTLNYTLLSLAAMAYFEFFNPVDLLTQILVQLIFIAVLILGMWGAFKPAKKSDSNNQYLKMENNQLIMIRNVISVVKTRAERRTDIPANVLQEIVTLQEEVQQIVPGNEYVALKIEGRIMLEMNQLLSCVKEKTLDLKKLHFALKNCFKLIGEFRDTYDQVQYGGS